MVSSESLKHHSFVQGSGFAAETMMMVMTDKRDNFRKKK